MALIAFRTIRGGFYAASHFITPGKEWIEKSESKIDQLVRWKRNRVRVERSRLKEIIRKGQKGSSPDVFWTVILEIGFFAGWIAFRFIFRKWDRRKATRTALAARLGRSCSAFFAMWIIG